MKSIFSNRSVIAACCAALLVSFSAPSFAQKEEEERKFDNVKTQKVKALSQKVAKQLDPARVCLAPEQEEGVVWEAVLSLGQEREQAISHVFPACPHDHRGVGER